MSGPGTDRPSGDRLFEEAAAWFARMRGPGAEADRFEFEAWLALGEANRSAYNRAAEVFAMGKLLGEEPGGPDAGRPGRTRLRAFASTALLAVAAAATWLAFLDYRLHRSKDGIATDGRGVEAALLGSGAGERRLVRLSDGSLVRLAASTKLEVRFTSGRRSLRLDRGGARFQVARQRRPFIVLAGGGSVTAHGTIFDVALAADRRVLVRLLEGSVEVRLPPAARNAAADRVRRLRAGEAVSFLAAGPVERTVSEWRGPAGPGPSAGAPAAQASDYDSVRLLDLVAAANRTASRPIRVADARTGERRVSGRFRIDDPDLLAERLALLFNLGIDRTNPAELVLTGR